MSANLLQLKQLSCERDDRILFAGLELTVSCGDIVQVEGPNGSGKTTLLKVLTTLSADYFGEVCWRGQNLSKVRAEYLADMLYIGHSPGIKKSLSPEENLRWYCGMALGSPQMPISDALEKLDLKGFEDVPCHYLSAGQLRRVALARLLLTPATLWILDEPFTAIDKKGVANLEALMTDHVSRGGAVILTTHQDLTLKSIRTLNLSQFGVATSE